MKFKSRRGFVFPSWFGELIIILIVVGLVLAFVGIQAGPKLISVTQEDIIGRLFRAIAPEVAGVGNIGNSANDVCFSGAFTTLPTSTSGITCVSKNSCNKVFEVTATKAGGAGSSAISLLPDGLHAGLGRQMCKYSLAGKDWCTDVLGKDLEIASIAADADYTCGLFAKTELKSASEAQNIDCHPYLLFSAAAYAACEAAKSQTPATSNQKYEFVNTDKTRAFCSRNTDGKVILTTGEFNLALKQPAVIENTLYLFQKKNSVVKLYSYPLDKNKVRTGGKGTVVEESVYDVAAPAQASDKYLCYNTNEYTLKCITNKDGNTITASTMSTTQTGNAGADIRAGQILADDLIYTQADNGKWQINIKNTISGKVTNVGQFYYEPGSLVQSSKYICFRNGNTNEYVCVDKANKNQFSIVGGSAYGSVPAVDRDAFFPHYSGVIASINLNTLATQPVRSVNINSNSPALTCKTKVFGPQSNLYIVERTQGAEQASLLGAPESQSNENQPQGVLPVG